MPNPNDELKELLARYRQIKLNAIGRQSGETVREDELDSRLVRVGRPEALLHRRTKH